MSNTERKIGSRTIISSSGETSEFPPNVVWRNIKTIIKNHTKNRDVIKKNNELRIYALNHWKKIIDQIKFLRTQYPNVIPSQQLYERYLEHCQNQINYLQSSEDESRT